MVLCFSLLFLSLSDADKLSSQESAEDGAMDVDEVKEEKEEELTPLQRRERELTLELQKVKQGSTSSGFVHLFTWKEITLTWRSGRN